MSNGEMIVVLSDVISEKRDETLRHYQRRSYVPVASLGHEIHQHQQDIVRMMLKDGALFGAKIGPMQTRTLPGDDWSASQMFMPREIAEDF